MSALLITQSLLSAWQYMYKARDAFPYDEEKADAAEAKAEEDFLRVLRRERGEPSPAMLAGRDFEALCYDIADGRFRPEFRFSGEYEANGGEVMGVPCFPPTYDGALQIARIINGGVWQAKLSKRVRVGGTEFLLYGILDALKAGTIYDIKYKSRPLGSIDLAGMYLDSPQHPMYLTLCPEADRFVYLISDGTLLYQETYERGDVPPIADAIEQFMAYLDRACLVSVYKDLWTART